MSKDLIRLMNALFWPGADVIRETPWQPNVDVYRTSKGWLVKFELAGVRVEDIDLEVLGKRLTLRGLRRDTLHEQGKNVEPSCIHHRMEINYGRFERSLELPCDLSKVDIRSEYVDGLLHVHILNE